MFVWYSNKQNTFRPFSWDYPTSGSNKDTDSLPGITRTLWMQPAEEKMNDNGQASLTNTQNYPSDNISQSEAIAPTSRTQPLSIVPDLWEDEFNSSSLFSPSLQHSPWNTQSSGLSLNTSLSPTKPLQGYRPTNLPSIGFQDGTKQFSTSDDLSDIGNEENIYSEFLREQGISNNNTGVEHDHQYTPTKQSFPFYPDLSSTSWDTDKSTLPACNLKSCAHRENILGKNISSLERLSQLCQRQSLRDIGNTYHSAPSQKTHSSSTFQAPLRCDITAPSLQNSEAQYGPYKSPVPTATQIHREQTGMDIINTGS